MAWNLVDELSSTMLRRHFFVPLASIPFGQNDVRLIDRSMYTFEETYATLPAPDGRTSDVSLNIQIQIPVSGLSNENGDPDPLIRLHAIDKARIHFEPASGTMQDRLVLEMLTFAFYGLAPVFSIVLPRWFGRWKDAAAIPLKVIYENVDRAQLQNLLNGIAAPVDGALENRIEPTNGLSFPVEVIQTNKANFITQFLAGAANHFIFAKSGSVIGTAATDPANNTRRLLKLHVQYQDHTADNPHPMNPRELFHLIFGDDSFEAREHPLLVSLNEFGTTQTTVHPESKRMLLRPPLRTWKRVEWEAMQEVKQHKDDWKKSGSLGMNRFYNDHSRLVNNNRLQFYDANYSGSPKCNLFVSDICIRAGFCALVQPGGNQDNHWYFQRAGSYSRHIHLVDAPVVPPLRPPGRLAVTGAADDAVTTWAWKIENDIRAQTNRHEFLNNLMEKEGRCLIVAGARASGSGHIVLVKEVTAEPSLNETVGDGLQSIPLSIWHAGTTGGATNIPYTPHLGGTATNVAGSDGFIQLHLFEAQPGGDPDTVQGLRSLNVQNSHQE
jgi:hypothetical protein